MMRVGANPGACLTLENFLVLVLLPRRSNKMRFLAQVLDFRTPGPSPNRDATCTHTPAHTHTHTRARLCARKCVFVCVPCACVC